MKLHLFGTETACRWNKRRGANLTLAKNWLKLPWDGAISPEVAPVKCMGSMHSTLLGTNISPLNGILSRWFSELPQVGYVSSLEGIHVLCKSMILSRVTFVICKNLSKGDWHRISCHVDLKKVISSNSWRTPCPYTVKSTRRHHGLFTMTRTHLILQNVSESFKHRLGSQLVSGQYATIFRWLPAMEGVPRAPDPERGLIYDHHGYKPLTKWDHPPSSYRWSYIIAPY